jgi:hypothetical protein
MNYFVVGADGNKYGPASVDTLKQWVQEGRLSTQSTLIDAATNAQVQAGSVPGLFQTVPPTVPGAIPQQTTTFQNPPSYPATGPVFGGGVKPYVPQQESAGPLVGIIVRSGLALLFFFVFRGIGLVFAGYALYYAIQLKSNGSKYGTIAIVIAAVSLGIVLLGWAVRMNSL